MTHASTTQERESRLRARQIATESDFFRSLLDPGLDIAQYGRVIGSIPGWIAEGLAVDTDGSSYLRLIWRNTNGAVAVWCVDQYLNICGKSPALGPYVGVAPER